MPANSLATSVSSLLSLLDHSHDTSRPALTDDERSLLRGLCSRVSEEVERSVEGHHTEEFHYIDVFEYGDLARTKELEDQVTDLTKERDELKASLGALSLGLPPSLPARRASVREACPRTSIIFSDSERNRRRGSSFSGFTSVVTSTDSYDGYSYDNKPCLSCISGASSRASSTSASIC
jgi:hypothetical protein